MLPSWEHSGSGGNQWVAELSFGFVKLWVALIGELDQGYPCACDGKAVGIGGDAFLGGDVG
ncbi:MAG: hypothetical protein JWS10_2909 [Cypionkella sp.]|nr:hypothetical protein [Cypionkella sp.]